MTDNNKTFLICHRGALGNFILSWPAILLLKKHFPEYKFVGLGRPDYMKLAVKLGIMDECHDAESAKMQNFFENGVIPEELGKPGKGVLWLKDARTTVELLKKNSGCDFAPIEPFPSEKLHVAKYHLREVLNYFKIDLSKGGGFSNPPKANLNGGLESPPSVGFIPDPLTLIPEPYFPAKNTIYVHPGSGSSKKNYSPAFYLEAAKYAKDHFKTDVKFILGPVEIENGSTKFFPPEKILTPENSSSLADILSETKLFIGNDSGVSHLAGFLGVPTIVLYKETDPEIWGVVGRKTAYLINPLEIPLLRNLKDFLVSGNIF
ncbi:MAG TPA: hypothetical protein DCZ94_07520 [Lentisphaeria bacterium]|nr:MAG: hypothetical protein A2X48_14195 [Lentisphaerae bacterium GWF2_49_21]HBC86785.1 hypothetical protein [Lentisphaeria bacterium]